MTETTNDRVRFGIIGFGKMGRIRADVISAHDGALLTAASDPSAEFAPDCGFETYRDYRALLETDIDAVVVATPNRFTSGIVCDALDAGKHVFCEKPPGRTMMDIARIMQAERRRPGLKLKFGFNHRYHSGIREAKRVVDSGSLGPILWMRGVYGKAGGTGFEESWRSSKELCGGGILLDQGIHMLDLFRFFSGDFVEIKSMVTTAHWPIEVEDNAFALLRDTHGRVAMLHSSSTQWKHRFNLEIYMAEGFVSVNGILSSTRSYGEETITVARKAAGAGAPTGKPREETVYFDTDPSWELEIDEFVDSIRLDRAIQTGTSADAMEAMRMVYAIYGADQSAWNPHASHDESPATPDSVKVVRS